MNYIMIISISIIIVANILVAYMRVWIYHELFKQPIWIKTLLIQWLLSVWGALWVIKWIWIVRSIVKVWVEESVKISSSLFARAHRIPSDHIATGVLAWVWFALIENILYLWYTYWTTSSYLLINTIRASTNSILHALFTWLIGFGIYQWIARKQRSMKILWGIGYILLGVWLHLLYNRSLINSYTLIAILIPIIWYFWLSYLLYRSDSLYLSS